MIELVNGKAIRGQLGPFWQELGHWSRILNHWAAHEQKKHMHSCSHTTELGLCYLYIVKILAMNSFLDIYNISVVHENISCLQKITPTRQTVP